MAMRVIDAPGPPRDPSDTGPTSLLQGTCDDLTDPETLRHFGAPSEAATPDTSIWYLVHGRSKAINLESLKLQPVESSTGRGYGLQFRSEDDFDLPDGLVSGGGLQLVNPELAYPHTEDELADRILQVTAGQRTELELTNTVIIIHVFREPTIALAEQP